MTENQVRVSLSQLADRLPYYPSVAKQVQAPQVVDMEAGIYTKPKAAYDAYLSQLIYLKISIYFCSKCEKD